jgi:hypothetical protein
MDRLRLSGSICLTLALVLIAARQGRAQEPEPAKVVSTPRAGVSADADERTCVVYSLDKQGVDPDLGQWVAETVPDMVAPGTWKEAGGPGALRYYAPKNILVVYHTPAVQAQVDAFLKKVTQAATAKKEHAASAKTSTPGRGVVHAGYRTPAELKPPAGPEPPMPYPVPAPVRAPKHLFHFIIRYEGDGVIDDSVVQAMKTYYRAEGKEKGEKRNTCAPTCGVPVAPPTDSSGPPSISSTPLPPDLTKPIEQAAPKPGRSKKGSKTS